MRGLLLLKLKVVSKLSTLRGRQLLGFIHVGYASEMSGPSISARAMDGVCQVKA